MSFCVLGWAGGDIGFSWGSLSFERFRGVSRSPRLYSLLGTGESATKAFGVGMQEGGRLFSHCTAVLYSISLVSLPPPPPKFLFVFAELATGMVWSFASLPFTTSCLSHTAL